MLLKRDDLLNKINAQKGLASILLQKYNMFSNALKDGETIDRTTYDFNYDGIASGPQVFSRLLQIAAENIDLLNEKISYYTNLRNVQIDEPDEEMRQMIQMANNKINNYTELLRLSKEFRALILNNSETYLRIKKILNNIYNNSVDSSLQGTILRTQKDALKATVADDLAMKKHLEFIKKSSKNVYKGGIRRNRKTRNKR